jgi:hypothetical protein
MQVNFWVEILDDGKLANYRKDLDLERPSGRFSPE